MLVAQNSLGSVCPVPLTVRGKIVERGAVVSVERHSVIPPHLERESIILAESASHHGNHFAQQCLGFFEAL